MKKLLLIIFASLLLTACNKGTWQVESQLDESGQAVAQEKITTYTTAITGDEAEIADYVELARAYESIGQIGEAMDVYKNAKEKYTHSQAIESNIAMLYEKAGLPKKAIKQHWYVVETFKDTAPLYNIIRLNIQIGDAKNAEIAYGQYLFEQTGGKRDPQFEQQINALKGVTPVKTISN